MSRVTSCCVCKCYNMQEHTCRKYPDGVPSDVFVEIIKCEEYCVKKYEDEDEDDDKDVPIVRRIPGTPFYEVIEN